MRSSSSTFALASLSAAAALFSGCSSLSPNRIDFPGATINGQPAHVMLDTGAELTLLTPNEAKYLKVHLAPIQGGIIHNFDKVFPIKLSDPVQFAPGSESLVTRLPVLDLPFLTLTNFDAVVGWPDVQDNILVFDSDTHTVRRIEELPPETAHWTKLKIFPGSQMLNLEVRSYNGLLVTLNIDTGRSDGLVLKPEDMQKWEKAHPTASDDQYKNYSLSLILSAAPSNSIIADEFNFGPFTLSHIFLRSTDWKIDGGYGATFGLQALERMNLIVDGIRGYAYIQAKPATSSLTAPAGWSVAANVHVSSNHMLAISYFTAATLKEGKGDEAGAIADYTTAINRDPRYADLYYNRAWAHQILGEHAEALSDYQQYLKLVSDTPEKYTQLAVYLLKLRLGENSDDFAKIVSGWNDSWAKTIGQFLLGQVDETALLAAAEKSYEEPVKGQQCEAYYYIGMKRLLNHDPDGAREFFKKCLASGQKDYDEYKFANAELARLDGASK